MMCLELESQGMFTMDSNTFVEADKNNKEAKDVPKNPYF